MAFITVHWRPKPRQLRIFGITMLIGLGAIGSLFHFWLGFTGFATFLWTFGALSFLTGITGTVVALPFYWLWTGFAFVISQTLGYGLLVLIFYLVVTPIGLLSRIMRRDRLALKDNGGGSYWQPIRKSRDHHWERQF